MMVGSRSQSSPCQPGWPAAAAAAAPRLTRSGRTAAVGSTRTQPRPASHTSLQAWASDWRTSRYWPSLFQ